MAISHATKQITIRPHSRVLLDRLRAYAEMSVADAAGIAIREACESRGIDTAPPPVAEPVGLGEKSGSN